MPLPFFVMNLPRACFLSVKINFVGWPGLMVGVTAGQLWSYLFMLQEKAAGVDSATLWLGSVFIHQFC